MSKKDWIRTAERDAKRLITYCANIAREPLFQVELQRIRKECKINIGSTKLLFKNCFMNKVDWEWERIFIRLNNGGYRNESFDVAPRFNSFESSSNELFSYWRACWPLHKDFSIKWGLRRFEAAWIVISDFYPPYWGMGPMKRILPEETFDLKKSKRSTNLYRAKYWPKRGRLDTIKIKDFVISKKNEGLKPKQIHESLEYHFGDLSLDKVSKLSQREGQYRRQKSH